MTGTLDELYLRWLYSQISPLTVRNPARTYWSFAKQLYTKEFIWFVPNDDNRVADGRALRDEFLIDYDIDDVDDIWLNLGCSMLEMLVALSRRLAFMVDCEPRDAFWNIIENLEAVDWSDKRYKEVPSTKLDAEEMMDRVIWRLYSYDGEGGMFPLHEPKSDQRKTEIWYQMAAWVIEMEGG